MTQYTISKEIPISMANDPLVLAFSVVGVETSSGGGNKQVVEPVVMINPTIEFVSGRDVGFADVRSWTIRPEIMK
jgi:hypothetical protein